MDPAVTDEAIRGTLATLVEALTGVDDAPAGKTRGELSSALSSLAERAACLLDLLGLEMAELELAEGVETPIKLFSGLIGDVRDEVKAHLDDLKGCAVKEMQDMLQGIAEEASAMEDVMALAGQAPFTDDDIPIIGLLKDAVQSYRARTTAELWHLREVSALAILRVIDAMGRGAMALEPAERTAQRLEEARPAAEGQAKRVELLDRARRLKHEVSQVCQDFCLVPFSCSSCLARALSRLHACRHFLIFSLLIHRCTPLSRRSSRFAQMGKVPTKGSSKPKQAAEEAAAIVEKEEELAVVEAELIFLDAADGAVGDHQAQLHELRETLLQVCMQEARIHRPPAAAVPPPALCHPL